MLALDSPKRHSNPHQNGAKKAKLSLDQGVTSHGTSNEHFQKQETVENGYVPKSTGVQESTIQALIPRGDAVALIYGRRSLTFNDLHALSDSMAAAIGFKTKRTEDSFVLLFLERSEFVPVAMLGILKAGAALVPVDIEVPEARFQFILKDTHASVIVTNKKLRESVEKWAGLGVSIIDIESFAGEGSSNNVVVDEGLPVVNPSNLAYCIYTSGTTGVPKGVLVEHRAVISMISPFLDTVYRRSSKPTVHMSLISYVFDMFQLECWTPLIVGGTLHITSESIRKDAVAVGEYIEKHSVTHMVTLPAMLSNIPKKEYKSLELIALGGEKCGREVFNYWAQTGVLNNGYGPTETTIGVIFNDAEVDGEAIIGRPLPGCTAYIVDSNNNLLPAEKLGELLIGGPTLARGYLNQPKLTSAKFVNLRGTGERVYRTGDMARFLNDGRIQFEGRTDFQVKLNGYRIELGEVEAVIARFPGVKQVIADIKTIGMFDGVGKKVLVGYYMADQALDEQKMHNFLRSQLVSYMVPAAIVHLYNFPLKVTGKFDREALPLPTFTNNKSFHIVAPTTPVQEKLIQIWSLVLGIESSQFGIEQEFTSLGGDSISLMRLIGRIRRVLQIKVTVAEMEEHNTISKFCNKFLQ